METSQAKKMVVISAIIVFTLGIVRFFTDPAKTAAGAATGGGSIVLMFVIPVGFAFFFLSVLADFAPEIAGPMAVLIMTASIFQNAVPVLTFLDGLTSSTARTKKGSKGSTTKATKAGPGILGAFDKLLQTPNTAVGR